MKRRAAWPLWAAAVVAVAAATTFLGTQLAAVRAGAEILTPDPTPLPAPPGASPTPAPSPMPSPHPSPVASPAPSLPPIRNGPYLVAPGSSLLGSDGRLLRYTVEVEELLDIDVAEFARAVEQILGDPRSWIGGGSLRLERVDRGTVRFRVTLASPETVDRACRPLRTGSWLSCWNGSRVMLNVDRWTDGAETYGDDVAAYRQYLVNHEVGHALGHDHANCPGRGEPAPIMLQQTKSLFGCLPNPWPNPDNGGSANP